MNTPQPANTASINVAGAGQAREKSSAEKLLGDAGASYDPKLREKLIGDLNKFPAGALDKLLSDGWSVSVVDNKAKSNGATNGGRCRTEKKIIEVDRTLYGQQDTDGKILLHEVAHALDFKGNEAPGLLRKMLGVQGKAIMGTDTNTQMAGIFQRFQSQSLISSGHQAMQEAKKLDPNATTVALSTAFNPKMQAAVMEGSLVVAYDQAESHNQAKSLGVKTAVGETPATMDFQGVEVKNNSIGKNNFTIVDANEASKLSLDWTTNDSYVAASNLPSELFAEGVSAYLASPESRDKLMQQSPDLHAFVQSSMNEFLIADQR